MNFKCRFRAKSIKQTRVIIQLKNKWTLVILKNCDFFNDLRLIPGSEAFGRGGGGAYRYRLCDTRNEDKEPS